MSPRWQLTGAWPAWVRWALAVLAGLLAGPWIVWALVRYLLYVQDTVLGRHAP